MSIKSAHLQNFTVFEKLEVEFSNGINVVIGTNGTGKTHLLKVLYAINQRLADDNIASVGILQHYFSVVAYHLKNNKDISSIIEVHLDNNEVGKLEINQDEPDIIFSKVKGLVSKSIFIPAKEMLSHSKGF